MGEKRLDTQFEEVTNYLNSLPGTAPKELDEETILNLYQVKSYDEYYRSTKPVTEYIFRDERIYLKGYMLSPGSQTLISKKFEIVPPLTFVIFDKIKAKEIPKSKIHRSYNFSVSILKAIIGDDSKQKLDIKSKDIMLWLSLFCIYGEDWALVYIDYVGDPDACIEIDTREGKDANEKVNILGEYKDLIKREQRNEIANLYVTSNIKATCHLILITLLKSFSIDNTVRDTQLNNYITQRKKAVFASMGCMEGSLVVKDQFFLELSDVMKTLPKLLTKFYVFITRTQATDSSVGSAAMLVASSAMTIIMAMIEFCDTTTLSKAHTNRNVLCDVAAFDRALNAVKMDMKNAEFHYFRMLRPSDNRLNAALFPFLATAAIAYKQKFTGGQSFSNVALPSRAGVSKSLIIDAQTIETRDLFDKDAIITQHYTETMKEGMRRLKIDYAKVVGGGGELAHGEAADLNEVLEKIQDTWQKMQTFKK